MNRWATGILLVYFLAFFTVKMTEGGRTEDSGSLSKSGAGSEESGSSSEDGKIKLMIVIQVTN